MVIDSIFDGVRELQMLVAWCVVEAVFVWVGYAGGLRAAL